MLHPLGKLGRLHLGNQLGTLAVLLRQTLAVLLLQTLAVLLRQNLVAPLLQTLAALRRRTLAEQGNQQLEGQGLRLGSRSRVLLLVQLRTQAGLGRRRGIRRRELLLRHRSLAVRGSPQAVPLLLR